MTNAEILVKAYRGISTLTERQKAITKEHTERRKKLGELMDAVNKGDLTQELELGGITGISLTPELEDLLENPAHGL